MSRNFFVVVTVVVLVLSSVSLSYTGGSGTPENPYQIASKADLLALAGTVEDYNKCFILTADINMADQVFTSAIIGAADFTGTFDGNNLRITNFTISGDSIGLFAQVGYGGSVKNLSIGNYIVSGYGGVGGLVGINAGSIANCYSTGVVSGTSDVGGLVGDNYGDTINCYSTGTVSGTSEIGGLVGFNGGTISNCYSWGDVNGTLNVGGLVGYNYTGCISNCYSTGTVSGTSDIGGLVGFNDGIISNCYFLITNGPDNGCGQPLTDEQMKQQASFVGWDFLDETADGTCNYWYMPPDAYPTLSTFYGYIPPELPGSGTEENPYVIANANDLGTVWFRLAAHYILANDINLTGITWSVAVVPAFNGVFDGNGFSINNLSINGCGRLGLFGTTSVSSQIKNLGLEDCTIIGTGYHLGCLVGENGSNISNCHSTGNISGSWGVGGLVGYHYASITNCYSTVNVSGSCIGGLVGVNGVDYSHSISNCYSTGDISGTDSVGGLVGLNQYGSVSNSYSIGTVNGTANVGGLIGKNYDGGISNCYSTGAVSGASYVGGLLGLNQVGGSITGCYFLITSGPDNGYSDPLTDAQMKQQASFLGWDFIEIWNIGENQTYPFLRKYLPSDIDMDGQTNFYDLAIFASHWFEQTSWHE